MHEEGGGHNHDPTEGGVKRLVVYLFIAVLLGGLAAFAVTGGAA